MSPPHNPPAVSDAAAAQLRIVFDLMSEGALLYGRRGRILRANASAASILGLSLEQLHTGPMASDEWQVFDADGAPLAPEATPAVLCARRGQPVNGQVLRLERPNASPLWLNVNASPLKGRKGRVLGVVATFADVTEAWMTRAALTSALEAARGVERAKTAFLANMSHEVRTPLNGVIAVAEALSATRLTRRQRDLVEVIGRSGRALETHITSVLELARLSSGGIVLEEEAVSLPELVLQTATPYRDRADAKGLDFHVSTDDAPTGLCLIDRGRLRQVLCHLMSNAVKFTSSGRVAVSVARRGEAAFVVSVEDTGVGFDPARLARLLDRADGPAFGLSGPGLGLAISRELVELMNGAIYARSDPDSGSVFEVLLPFVPARPDRELSGQETLGSSPAALVADDHPANRLVLREVLEPLGFQVKAAEDGQVALDTWLREAPDIVFMDLQMPVMDGLQAIARIREQEAALQRPRTPIVMVTAHVSEHHRLQAFRAGADAYLAKPITMAGLQRSIETALDHAADAEVRSARTSGRAVR